MPAILTEKRSLVGYICTIFLKYLVSVGQVGLPILQTHFVTINEHVFAFYFI